MAAKPMAPSAAPSILFAYAGELGTNTDRRQLLEEAAALGFNQLLLGAPFAQDLRQGVHDLNLLGDVSRFDPEFGKLTPEIAVKVLADECHRVGICLYLDIALERVSQHGGVTATLGSWQPPRDEPLNPRAPGFGQPGYALPWRNADIAATLLSQLHDLLDRLSQSGAAGFRLIGLDAPSAAQLNQLIVGLRRTHPQLLFYAETEGIAAQVVDALAGVPFSGVFASLPWWDFRATWFFTEHRQISRLGRVLMPVAASHISAAHFDAVDAARRALVAAGLGDGMLLPLRCVIEARSNDALKDAIVRANALLEGSSGPHPARLQLLSAPEQAVTVVERRDGATSILIAINSSADPEATPVENLTLALPTPAASLTPVIRAGEHISPIALVGGQLVLAGNEVGFFRAQPLAPVRAAPANRQSARRVLDQAIAAPRVAIEAVSPCIDDGQFAVRANAGATLDVEADVFCDGHDLLAVRVQWRALDDVNWRESAMKLVVNDRYLGTITLERMGSYEFVVEAWVDRFGTWLKSTGKKRDAGLDLSVEIVEATTLVEEYSSDSDNKALKKLAEELKKSRRNATLAYSARLEALFNPATQVLMDEADPRHHASQSSTYPLHAERRAARYASWYELFPRSMSTTPGQHGTLLDVIEQLPRIAAMGFDVLYFTPIHPIGRSHRKGLNNALSAGPNDPGSPYAIGSDAGGHDALHPELGTLEDFVALVDAAATQGLEIALDFAVQCSPDHPWLKQHPEWFRFRPDGSLPYAENPPKKYEDIVNVDFYTDRLDAQGKEQAPALWAALRDAVLFWVERGVRIFRVDNPHTKPLPFWQWMISTITAQYPDVLFLAEAFTAPKMMARLAKVGFTQSYTYFTWRNSKAELSSYLEELNQAPLSLVYRPHFFVNTPDINPVFLQQSGRAGFLIRAALASMLSGLWGMYSGFELCEATPVPGKEEYLDSEKYQLRQRDFSMPGNIVAEITQLNFIRRSNPALQTHLGISFHHSDNDNMLYFTKATKSRDNVIAVVINLDFRNPQSSEIELPLWQWGLDDSATLLAEDLIEGHQFAWHGKRQRVTIDPAHRPYAIWRVAPPRP